jgi:predicted nuclease of predicted toxin-antitoxin system
LRGKLTQQSRVEFYLDECVPPRVAHQMRSAGLDVLTVYDTNMQGRSDPAELALSARERRMLITYDRDFFDLDASGQLHAGIIHARSGETNTQALIQYCLSLAGGSGRVAN